MTRPIFPAEAGIEPDLADIFDDPIFHLLLERDGLNVADVRTRIRNWRIKCLNESNPQAA